MAGTMKSGLVPQSQVADIAVRERISKVALCIFNSEADFAKWSEGYASFEEYEQAVEEVVLGFEAKGIPVTPIFFDEASYLEYLAENGLQPHNAREHSTARSKWTHAIASDPHKHAQYVARLLAEAERLVAEDSAEVSGTRRVLETIRTLPGTKIVTVTAGEYTGAYDVHENGQVGYAPEHEAIFLNHLGLAPLAAVTIRRFLTDTYVNEDAERVLRYKVVYGLLVRDGQIEAVSADEMRRCHNTDAITGEPLTPEDGVMFGDLSEQVAAS